MPSATQHRFPNIVPDPPFCTSLSQRVTVRAGVVVDSLRKVAWQRSACLESLHGRFCRPFGLRRVDKPAHQVLDVASFLCRFCARRLPLGFPPSPVRCRFRVLRRNGTLEGCCIVVNLYTVRAEERTQLPGHHATAFLFAEAFAGFGSSALILARNLAFSSRSSITASWIAVNR